MVWEGWEGPSGWEEEEEGAGSYDHSYQPSHLFPFSSFSFKSLESCWEKHCLWTDKIKHAWATSCRIFLLSILCLKTALSADQSLPLYLVKPTQHNVLHATSLWWVPLPIHQYWSGCGPNNPPIVISPLLLQKNLSRTRMGIGNNNNIGVKAAFWGEPLLQEIFSILGPGWDVNDT